MKKECGNKGSLLELRKVVFIIMIITCKCLNISLDLGKTKPKGIPLQALKLSTVEEAHKFFSEGVAEIDGNIEIDKQVVALTNSTTVGRWIIETCLNCSQHYLAKHKENLRPSLISAGLIADPNTMQMLRSRPEFSPVFHILIEKSPSQTVEHEDTAAVQSSLSRLQQQFSSVVKKEAEKTDEKIRVFTDMEHESLEKFRDRAIHDHEALARVLRDFDKSSETLEEQSSLPTPPNKSPTAKSSPGLTDCSTPLPRSSSRAVVQRSFSVSIPGHNSYDNEGVFNLDDMENFPDAVGSDVESDTDHDDSSSHDEGIDLRRKKTPIHLARSVPVKVPAFPSEGRKLKPLVFTDDVGGEERMPNDIAASIKEIARSVHGDIFGELPRPRFSTQI